MLRKNCGDLLSGGRALDVGAGVGDFVSCLSHLGMRASGLEAFAPSAVIGRSHGLDVLDGRFDKDTLCRHFGDERFGLISFREALYYLDLGEALGLIRERLVPNGALYIKTHVAESPYYWRGMKMIDRLGNWVSSFYSTQTLTHILRQEQFNIVAIRHASISPAQAAKGWAIAPGLPVPSCATDGEIPRLQVCEPSRRKFDGSYRQYLSDAQSIFLSE
ncbi:MAG: methyltransferase domain-containing protein [Xanthobacteraceae bacterium]